MSPDSTGGYRLLRAFIRTPLRQIQDPPQHILARIRPNTDRLTHATYHDTKTLKFESGLFFGI